MSLSIRTEPATILPDRYVAVGELARREQRLVLRCHVPAEENRACVLKCLLGAAGEAEREAFRAEYLLLDALEHPNWVRPRRLGPLRDGGLALELEEAEGVPLSRWPLAGWWPENLEIARQILTALQALHRLGVAQLDLCPDQVMIAPSRDISQGWEHDEAGREIRVRLLDLGLAARFGSIRAGRGTPGYMAPELFDGRGDWDDRADLYAAGACLFELLTGRRAFPGASAREVLHAQLSGERPDPGSQSGLPPPVRALLGDLLQRDPARRPRSALAVWQALREQAQRRDGVLLPPGLAAGGTFAFHGRDDEVAAFRAWLNSLRNDPAREAASLRIECRIRGALGSGRHRLVARLAAYAQAEGWKVEAESHGSVEIVRDDLSATIRVVEASAPRPPADVATADVLTPSSGIDPSARGPVLEIELAPLPEAELRRILEGQGMESAALRETVAGESLGLPGLLHALVRTLPREADLAARYAAEASLVDLFATISPPPEWIGYLDRVLTGASEAERDAAVLLALTEERWESASLARVLGVMDRDIALGLQRLAASGLVTANGPVIAYRSALWRRTATAWSPERTGRLARFLVRGGLPEGRFSATQRARLALSVEDVDVLAASLSAAIAELTRQEADEEALCLWRDACRAGVSPARLYAAEVARPLLDAIAGWSMTYGSPLPGTDELPSDPAGGAFEPLFRAWSAWLERDFTRSLDLTRAAWSDPALDFQRRILRARSLVHLGRHAEAAAEIEANVPGDQPTAHHEARLALVRAELAGRRGDLEEAMRWWMVPASRAEELPLLDRIYALHGLGLARFQRGEIEAARAAMAPLEDLVHRTELRTHRGVVPTLLCGIAFQEGRLRQSQAWLEDLAGFWLTRGVWNRAAVSLYNLGLILIERGWLGRAVRVDHDLAGVCQLSGEVRELARVGVHRSHLLVRSGQLERGLREADAVLERFGDAVPRYRLLVEATRAEALAGLGRPAEARAAFRQVVDRFTATGGREDAMESLLHWALREAEAGESDRLQALLSEFDHTGGPISPLTASLRALAGGEGSLLAGRTDEAAAGLQRAVTLLESQERWLLAWRAHWRLAQALRLSGSPRRAAEHYATARSVLTAVVESLGDESPASLFLESPAIRQFLDDLGQD